ncbi:MAG: AGE family epimerase/isomerase, partial [Spirochaetes bacterium]|nr:AGE family epimerase/isomerase [Spirochaetota bacterium]
MFTHNTLSNGQLNDIQATANSIHSIFKEKILLFWQNKMVDRKNGGFYGEALNNNHINSEASRGLILNTRILWSFSRAYRFYQNEEYRKVAEYAYQYLVNHFHDKEYGGFFWKTDSLGNPLDK